MFKFLWITYVSYIWIKQSKEIIHASADVFPFILWRHVLWTHNTLSHIHVIWMQKWKANVFIIISLICIAIHAVEECTWHSFWQTVCETNIFVRNWNWMAVTYICLWVNDTIFVFLNWIPHEMVMRGKIRNKSQGQGEAGSMLIDVEDVQL